MARELRWPAISRALARHDAATALVLLREQLRPVDAGRALLELTRTQHDWPKVEHVDESALPTSRELQMLRCAARGLSVNDTARELFVSPDTIASRRKRVYAKLGVSSVQAATAVARERGLID